jgi:hypothetical protein
MQAWQTCELSAFVHLSTFVRAEKSLSANEQIMSLFIFYSADFPAEQSIMQACINA